MKAGFEVFEHAADTGIEVLAPELTSLFEQAAAGMFSLMFEVPAASPEHSLDLAVEASGLEEVLVAWLGELLYASETEDLVFWEFRVEEVDDRKAAGMAAGNSLSGVEVVGPPIKAVTYHQLEVTRLGDGWKARIIFDV